MLRWQLLGPHRPQQRPPLGVVLAAVPRRAGVPSVPGCKHSTKVNEANKERKRSDNGALTQRNPVTMALAAGARSSSHSSGPHVLPPTAQSAAPEATLTSDLPTKSLKEQNREKCCYSKANSVQCQQSTSSRLTTMRESKRECGSQTHIHTHTHMD